MVTFTIFSTLFLYFPSNPLLFHSIHAYLPPPFLKSIIFWSPLLSSLKVRRILDPTAPTLASNLVLEYGVLVSFSINSLKSHFSSSNLRAFSIFISVVIPLGVAGIVSIIPRVTSSSFVA